MDTLRHPETRRSRWTPLALAPWLLLSACSGPPPASTVVVEHDLVDQARRSETPVSNLYYSPAQTLRCLRVEAAIPLHVHEWSEETIYLLEGSGTLHLGEFEKKVGAGDLVVVPRNTPHGFTPDAEQPCSVLSIFAPEFQEGDRVPVTVPGPR